MGGKGERTVWLLFLLVFSQAVHTGMRAYIYNKNSVIGSQAEHTGMRTYYFSADTQEDMNAWIRAMNQAALMQTRSSLKRQVPLWSFFFFKKLTLSYINCTRGGIWHCICRYGHKTLSCFKEIIIFNLLLLQNS